MGNPAAVDQPRLLVTTRPASAMPPTPLRATSVPYKRDLPEVIYPAHRTATESVDMREIIKRNARAILLDGDDLILIKRTKPGRAPYWVTVGGGVDEEDSSIEDALHREVFEELGGKLARAELVHLITDKLPNGLGVQHIFAARLSDMDLSARTGTEFSKPERGQYKIVRIPFTADAIRGIELMPPQLASFAAANVEAILSVLHRPTRKA